MRCRTHPSDPGAGVCACCLRERLSALDVFPVEEDGTPSLTICKKTVSSSSSFSLFCPWPSFPDFFNQRSSVLFSHKWGKQTPKKLETNAVVVKPSVSNYCLLALILRRRMNNKKIVSNTFPAEEDSSRGKSRKPHELPENCRGTSPESKDERKEGGLGLGFRRNVAAVHPHQMQQSPCSVSSFLPCLNPLLRPSPGNRRSHCTARTVLAGQLRGTFIRRNGRGGATIADASFGLVPNRSRKLVDFEFLLGST